MNLPRESSGQRQPVIDLLRGLALFGVLQVNIQSFTWGSGRVLGYLQPGEGIADSLTYWLLSAFVQGKCYPVLGMLFGYGMAQQWRQWARHPEGVAPRTRLMRRCLVLGLLGLAHGCLLYFGDVLLAYAACAALLGLASPQRTRDWITLTRACAIGALFSLLAPVLLDPLFAQTAETSSLPWGLLELHRIYAEDGWKAEFAQRLDDEFWQQLGSIPDFWPQVLCFMGVGVLAQRQGWLRRPGRHNALGRQAWRLGLSVGLPCALLGASLDLLQARQHPGQSFPWIDVIQGAGSLLSCAYLVGIVRTLDVLRAPGARRIASALAATGRLSLTHYVSQSLAMGLLLSGWGCGLGRHASHLQLAVLAATLYGAQVAVSGWYLRHHAQGPLESLWRRAYDSRSAVTH